MANTSALDLEGVMAFGLFSADGRHLAGNLAELPPDIAADGRVLLLAHGVRRTDRLAVQRARALSLRLDNRQLLVLARSTSVIDQVEVILRQTMPLALLLTLLPGLMGAFLLPRCPWRRVATTK